MARVNGKMPLSGKVGDLIFFERDGKVFVRSKPNKPIKQSEASKKNSKDFGTAVRTAARIRKAFRPVLKSADGTLVSRMNKQITIIYTTIPKKFAGNKQIIHGDVDLLNGFQFNPAKRLQTLLWTFPDFTVVPSGCMHIDYHERSARMLFKGVAMATAAVIEVMIFCMDLQGDDDQIIPVQPLTIGVDEEFDGAKLMVPLDLMGDRLVLVAMGIQYVSSESTPAAAKTWASGIVFAKKYKDAVELPFIREEVEQTIVEKKITGVGWNVK